MTNHETLLRLQYMYDANNSFMVGRRKEIEIAMKAIKELEKYQEIGTVEELKELKDEQQNKCKDCAGCTMWKCDCANERAYAIDEFAEKILEYCSMSEMNRKMIKQIAEQLKEGGK